MNIFNSIDIIILTTILGVFVLLTIAALKSEKKSKPEVREKYVSQVHIIFAFRADDLRREVNHFLKSIDDEEPKIQVIMTEPDTPDSNSYKYAVITYLKKK